MRRYAHRWLNGETCSLPVGKAVCVGRNYAQHAKELNNPIPSEPLLFIKPSTSFTALQPSFAIPAIGECHHELELAFLVQSPLKNAQEAEVLPAIAGVALALDLTMRDRQQKVKEAGHPWEVAKAFDGALPMSDWIPVSEFTDLQSLEFSLRVNHEVRQQGNAADMIHGLVPLIVFLTSYFSLEPGDVVLTGTPAGVNQLKNGDFLVLNLAPNYRFESLVMNA